jgi:cell division protein FtsQ
MRPVKNDRKPRGSARGKASRAATRTVRIKQTPQRSSRRRTLLRDDPVSRTMRRVRAWLTRPLMLFCGMLVCLVVLAALLVGGYVGRAIHGLNRIIDVVETDAGFGISEVHITGSSRTPPETLAAALGLEPGQSIFAADLPAARRRLLALDWVAQADVRRRYPDSINVRIVEKLPFALWQAPGGLYVIERSGGVITSRNLESFASLPKLIGPGANNGADIVDAIAGHRAISARVKAIERISSRRWNLILDGGVTVKMPEVGWQRQLDTLEHLIVDKGILERDVTEIDLRNTANFFFVLRSGEKKDVDRGKPI